MKVAVYPHTLEIGGSQYNAIELAAAVRDRGHEVFIYGQPGPLESRIAELGLEFVVAPRPRGRPSPQVMFDLCRVVRRRGIDVVHGYEWTAGLEGYFGPRAVLGVPAVTTVMSMAVAPFLPEDMPLITGTAQIADHERRRGRRLVSVIEPPVDTAHNRPGVVDTAEFARLHDLDPDALTVVGVQRLAADLKLEGLLAAVEVIGRLPDLGLQLVLVGDGVGRAQLEDRAAAVNARLGRRAVILTGELREPRPAYAVADVCIGMGGSALRAMAFGKPLIVQGENGFWELLTPETEQQFLWTGWYGVGTGVADGPDRLLGILGGLARDATRRDELGARAQRLVETRFSLEHAADVQLDAYDRALAARPVRARDWLAPGARSAGGVIEHRTRRRVADLRGRLAEDDFNARPVAALHHGR